MSPIISEQNTWLIKVMLLGDSTVGKTTLRHRYVGKPFNTSYLPTLGADFSLKKIQIENNFIKFQIWDVGGQENYFQIRKAFYVGAQAGILIYSVDNLNTFNNIENWLQELVKNGGTDPKPIIIVGNKIDLRNSLENGISYNKGLNLVNDLSKKFNLSIDFFETSAIRGENVEKIFEKIYQFYF